MKFDTNDLKENLKDYQKKATDQFKDFAENDWPNIKDLYTAYNRYQKHKVATKEIQSDSINGTKKLLTGIPSDSKADIISFTILGGVFTITGIVLFFMI